MNKYQLLIFNIVLLPVLLWTLIEDNPAVNCFYILLFSFTGFWRQYPKMKAYPTVGVFFNLTSILCQFFFLGGLIIGIELPFLIWMGGLGMGLIYFAYSDKYFLKALGWLILISLYGYLGFRSEDLIASPWQGTTGALIFIPAQMLLLYHALWAWGMVLWERYGARVGKKVE